MHVHGLMSRPMRSRPAARSGSARAQRGQSPPAPSVAPATSAPWPVRLRKRRRLSGIAWEEEIMAWLLLLYSAIVAPMVSQSGQGAARPFLYRFRAKKGQKKPAHCF